MPDEACGEVLRDTCALTLGDETLAGGVEDSASELRMTPSMRWSRGRSDKVPL